MFHPKGKTSWRKTEATPANHPKEEDRSNSSKHQTLSTPSPRRLHSKTIPDLIRFFPKHFVVKVQGQNSNGKTAKQTTKIRHVTPVVAQLAPPRNHARSRERFKVFTISQKHFVGDPPNQACTVKLKSFRSFNLLILHVGHFFITRDSQPFSVVSLTAFLFEFRPRIFIIELFEKFQQGIVVLESSFPRTLKTILH